MSDFRPFVDEDGVESELLRSALDDGASADARQRARTAFERALGGGGAGPGGGPAAPSHPPAAAPPVGLPLAAKIGGAAAVAILAALAAPVLFADRGSVTSAPASAPADAPSSSIVAPPVPPAPSTEPSADVSDEAPSASAAPSAPSAPPRVATQSGAPSRSLADEVTAIDIARHALVTGDAKGALDALDAYSRAFPHGELRETASILRVEALLRSGDRNAAVELARRTLRAHPGSPYAVKLRSLLPELDTNL